MFDLSDSNPFTVMFLTAFTRLSRLKSFRYFANRRGRKSLQKQFEDDLHENEDGSCWLNDAEFKRKYRV
jgi:hypothetical protein